jgi:hypothetical protein
MPHLRPYTSEARMCFLVARWRNVLFASPRPAEDVRAGHCNPGASDDQHQREKRNQLAEIHCVLR